MTRIPLALLVIFGCLVSAAMAQAAPPSGDATQSPRTTSQSEDASTSQPEPSAVAQDFQKGAFTRSRQIPEGMRVIAISVNDVQSISGMLRPGDRVDVLVTYQRRADHGQMETRTATLLKYIEVFGTDNKTVSDGATQQQGAKTRVVSLLVEPNQVHMIKLAESKGQLALSWRHPDDDEDVEGSNVDDNLLAELSGISANEDDVLSIVTDLKVFHLRRLDPHEAIRVLSSLSSGTTALSSVPSQRAVIANGTPDELQAIEALLTALDTDPNAEQGAHPPAIAAPIASPLAAGNPAPFAAAADSGEIKLFHLQHLSPDDAVNALSPLFGANGFQQVMLPGRPTMRLMTGPQFVSVPSQRILIVRGDADTLEKVAALIQALDVPGPETATGVVSFKLKKITARDIAAKLVDLQEELHVEFGIVINEKGNIVTVRGPQTSLHSVAEFIRDWDRESLQFQAADAEGIAVIESVGVLPKSPVDIATLRTAFAEHDARTRQHAVPLRERARSGELAENDERKQTLTKAVAEAFDARQKLQQAELAELETKLASLRRLLAARERIKDQIIQRRVEELLNPALEWDTSGASPPPTAVKGSTAGIIRSDSPVPFVTTRSGTLLGPSAPPERLYQGRTESDWQRLFVAETEPAAKLEAAVALLNLAAQLPPDKHVERILDIGEEIYRSAYGDAALEGAFDSSVTLQKSKHWTIDQSGDAGRLLNLYFTQLDNQTKSLLSRHLGPGVLRALLEGSDARAAYAFMLLRGPAADEVRGDRESSRAVFHGLNVPLTGLDRSTLCLLGQLQVSQSYDENQIDHVADKLCHLIRLIRAEPDEGLVRAIRGYILNIHWGGVAPDNRPFRTPRIAQELARLVLDETISERASTRSTFLDVVRSGFHNSRAEVLPLIRKRLGPALHAWTSVANDYLEERSAPYSEADHRVLQVTGSVVALHSDGDEWPVARTAEILTERLRSAYIDDSSAAGDVPVEALLPAMPSTMLAQIVAISGQLPEFVKASAPMSSGVLARLKRLDETLELARDGGTCELAPSRLLDEAPYQIISRCVDEGFPTQAIFNFHELRWTEHATPAGLLNAVSSRRAKPRDRNFAPIDPLLFLAIAADLSGKNKTQDDHIRSIFAPSNPPYLFRDPIQVLLASQLQSRHHAARMLRDMAAKTESAELLDMIRSIDPTAVEKDAPTEPPAGTEPGPR